MGHLGNGSFDADLEAGPETEIDLNITPDGPPRRAGFLCSPDSGDARSHI
jgi:hypothetical protein